MTIRLPLRKTKPYHVNRNTDAPLTISITKVVIGVNPLIVRLAFHRTGGGVAALVCRPTAAALSFSLPHSLSLSLSLASSLLRLFLGRQDQGGGRSSLGANCPNKRKKSLQREICMYICIYVYMYICIYVYR